MFSVPPKLMIPHSGWPVDDPAERERRGGPDISYASALDLGDGRLSMSYYEGYTYGPSDIRLVMLSV